MAYAGRRTSTILILVLALLVLSPLAGPAEASICERTSVGFTPLTDMRAGQYRGFAGGLYPGGSNTRPFTHDAAGVDLARGITPRRADGLPDAATGRIVFLSIGMSNTMQEFRTFMERAASDPGRHASVMPVNGAESGATASVIANPQDDYWPRLDERLRMAGVTPRQVQVVWMKEANAGPRETFPTDAEILRDDLRSVAAILKARFPNLAIVYLSSRIYGGYADTNLNPEPYAYQGGFAVKWLIEEQIQGGLPIANGSYPWLSWGPYLWADGMRARSDGLVWRCSDMSSDGTHPSNAGSAKVADMLLSFLHSDTTARIWYENGGGGSSGGQTLLCGRILGLLFGLLGQTPICPVPVAPRAAALDRML